VSVLAKARAEEHRDDDALKRDIISVGLATLGALVLVGLMYNGDAMGIIPAKVSLSLRTAVGLGAYAVPIWIFLLAALYGFETRPVAGVRVLTGTGLLGVALLVLLQVRLGGHWEAMFADHEAVLAGGGYIGAGLAYMLLRLLGAPGAYIFIAGISFIGIVLLTRRTSRELLTSVGNGVMTGGTYVRERAREAAAKPRARRRPAPAPTRKPRKKKRPKPQVELNDPDDSGPPVLRPPSEPLIEDKQPDPSGVAEGLPEPIIEDPAGLQPAETKAKKRNKKPKAKKPAEKPKDQPALLNNSDLFALPSVTMLTELPQEIESAEMREEAAEQIIKLEDTLSSFNISSKVTHYERGPVLTRYEVEPERGIRVNQVVRLADDLAMALAAVDVRVEAPIPGKSAIGIEVPNPTRATVSLRGLLEAEAYEDHESKLAFALGRDIAGKPVIVDLASMPHLLIAGATGSGKSVCLHSLIVSILMRATPDEVRMVMVDPKRVELAVYDGLPHLMAPVVHSVKQAADVLRKVIREMEKRYDQFAVKSVVNLAEYNELARMPKQHSIDEFEPLPSVVIVIDELADLMMQSRAEFEFSICRLAQLARATGIHLVLATQRPSVKVITGNIKANIPSRVALAVASLHDSRTILDGQGAERLIGRGDMLYAPIDASKPKRIQGAFVTRGDIERIVRHLQDQAEPEFSIVPEVPEEEEDFSGEMEASDELFAAAAEYVIMEQEASVSMIQRRFKVGYARAGRLIDMMERRGLVGPHEGSKPRHVLVAPGMADAVLMGRGKASQPDADTMMDADEDEGMAGATTLIEGLDADDADDKDAMQFATGAEPGADED